MSGLQGLRRWLVARLSTRRALDVKRFAADYFAVLWSVFIAGRALRIAAPYLTGNEEFIRGMRAADQLWRLPVVQVFGAWFALCFVWFWLWMALDCHERRFDDGEVISVKRLTWFAAVVALGWLTAPVYWFAVKRRAVLAELGDRSRVAPPPGARI